MTFLKNLARDLIEKKLWPVAATLLVGLVAVPLVLGSGGSANVSSESPADVAQRTGGVAVEPAATARVSVATATSDAKVSRAGSVRNPFRVADQPKAAAPAGDSAATPANGVVGAGTTDVGKAPGTGGATTEGYTGKIVPLPDVSTPVPTDKATAAQRRVYRVAIRFGESGAVTTRRDVARLTPLPSANKPLALFMGVLSDGKTVAFLLAPGVQARGQGWCRPTPEKCSTLEMRPGDDQTIEASSGTGGVVQYQLKVVRVARKVIKSVDKAEASHARHSKSGRDLLHTAVAKDLPGTDAYSFDAGYGILRLR